jgi:hypothetical protein
MRWTVMVFLSSIFIQAKELTGLDIMNSLGGILENQSTHISTTIAIFGLMLTIMMTIISLFAYSKSQDILVRIEKNKEKIDKIKEKLAEDILYIDKETKSNLKILREELVHSLNDVKDDIKQEVTQQIVYNSKEVALKVEDYAYKHIEDNIVDINNKVQVKLFSYQKFIFKVNEAKKIDYEEVVSDESFSFTEKLSKVIAIQSRYNETNNQSVPKLFSHHIEEEVVPTAIKLSEYQELHEIIIEHLEKLLLDSHYSFADKARVKEVLHIRYHWVEQQEVKENTLSV